LGTLLPSVVVGGKPLISFGENTNLWHAPAITTPLLSTQGRIRTHEPFGMVLETIAFDRSATCVFYLYPVTDSNCETQLLRLIRLPVTSTGHGQSTVGHDWSLNQLIPAHARTCDPTVTRFFTCLIYGLVEQKGIEPSSVDCRSTVLAFVTTAPISCDNEIRTRDFPLVRGHSNHLSYIAHISIIT
jgi:hypothetical protein